MGIKTTFCEWHGVGKAPVMRSFYTKLDIILSKETKSFQEAENILLEACPIIPLFQYNMIYAKDKKLEGYSLNSLGILDFKKAKF